MKHQNPNTLITVPADSAQSGVSEMIAQGGIAVAIILSLVLLIKALTGFVEAGRD